LTQQTLLLFYKTSYLNEEVNRTEPSPSVRISWLETSNITVPSMFDNFFVAKLNTKSVSYN